MVIQGNPPYPLLSLRGDVLSPKHEILRRRNPLSSFGLIGMLVILLAKHRTGCDVIQVIEHLNALDNIEQKTYYIRNNSEMFSFPEP